MESVRNGWKYAEVRRTSDSTARLRANNAQKNAISYETEPFPHFCPRHSNVPHVVTPCPASLHVLIHTWISTQAGRPRPYPSANMPLTSSSPRRSSQPTETCVCVLVLEGFCVLLDEARAAIRAIEQDYSSAIDKPSWKMGTRCFYENEPRSKLFMILNLVPVEGVLKITFGMY